MCSIEIVSIKDTEVPVGLAEVDINEISDDWLVGKCTRDLAVLGPFFFPDPVWVQIVFWRT
jgi:hypothetical protein